MKASRMVVKMAAAVVMVAALSTAAWGQGGPRGPVVNSPVVHEDGRVTFALLAPNAEAVLVTGSDLPGIGRGAAMTKGENGVWEATVGPIKPGGAYRYTFNVDGVSVVDPRNPSVSESNENVWSVVYVPGEAFMESGDVPHGSVSEVVYRSASLGVDRRMHVYLPAGYEKSGESYPVFYLLHGAFDSDDSWSTVGRAGFILDNLIAAGTARPMVVVMPDGHTGPFRSGGGLPVNEFVEDFESSVRPYVEKNYRVKTGRGDRAIAGLSMGGAHTLEIAMRNLGAYGYVGVFSSGVFGITGSGPGANAGGPAWTETHKAALENAGAREGLRLLWFGTGTEDFLLETTRATVKMFEEKGFKVEYDEAGGGHTWIVWREYLRGFAPKLFQ